MSDLTTYGALSCELAFLQSFAICFTLVVHSVKKNKMCCHVNSLIEHTRYFWFV